MAKPFRQRVREAIKFLSEIGGAIAAIAAGGAIVLGGLIALIGWIADVPFGFVVTIAVGLALITFGFGVSLLGRWRWLAAVPESAPEPAGSMPSKIAQLAAQGQEQQKAEEKRQLRGSLRTIAEELRDNRRLLEEGRETGHFVALFNTGAWEDGSSRLQGQEDPAPYRAASAAYRELGVLEDAAGRSQPGFAPDDTRYEGVLEAIDNAVVTLEQADL